MENKHFASAYILIQIRRTIIGVCLGAFIVLIVWLYISSEKFFYYWDLAGYHSLSNSFATTFSESPMRAFNLLQKSIGDDYNFLFVVPIIPFVTIFGQSRMVFVISIALVYFLPYALMVGYVARRLALKQQRQTLYLMGIMTTIFTGPAWIPTLRGYPDIGGALLLVIGIALYLKNIDNKNLLVSFFTGIFFAIAPLFRRHFGFSSIAILFSMVLHAAFYIVVSAKNDQNRFPIVFRDILLNILGVFFGVLVTMIIFGYDFVQTVIHTNYRALYSSYNKPIFDVLSYFAKIYGTPILFFSFIGLFLAMRSKKIEKVGLTFLILTGFVSLLLWVFAASQTGIQYSLQFTIIILLGLVFFSYEVFSWLSNVWQRWLFGTTCILFSLINLIFSLAPINTVSNNIPGVFLPYNAPPLVRSDYQGVVSLVNNLRSNAPRQPIYIIASSNILNPEIVRQAEIQLYGITDTRLMILPSPDIDSRDYYPISGLVQAQWVVLATPFQYHLLPTEQKVVKTAFDIFNDKQEISEGFIRWPIEFKLSDNVEVYLYRRIKPTPVEVIISSLKIIKSSVGMRPGQQPDWVLVSEFFPGSYIQRNREIDSIVTHPSPANTFIPTQFLYIGEKPHSISGSIFFRDDRCLGVTLFFLQYDVQHQNIATIGLSRKPGDEYSWEINLSESYDYIVMNISGYTENSSVDHCTINLGDLIAK